MADATQRSDRPGEGEDAFLESLMDTDLYSMGAFFCDQHPDLVDEVVSRSVEIEACESGDDPDGTWSFLRVAPR